LIILAGIAAEGLLILRLWAQVTSRPVDSGNLRFLFSITQDLASPFGLITHEEPLQTSGIVDFTVLVAIEGYLIVTLALIAVCFFVNRSMSVVRRHRRGASRSLRVLPDALWQSVSPPHSPAATYYLRAQPGRRHQKRRSA
jgi:hypothetical protein